MQNTIKCPSCNSDRTVALSVIAAETIVALYKRNGIITDEQFKGIKSVTYFHCTHCDLKFFNPAIAGNEDFYNQLQKKDWYFLHSDKTEFSYTANLVKENDRVLDVGSGRGVWSKYISGIKGVFYQGIEYSSTSIELAKKDGVNVIKQSIDAHATTFPASYDVVVAFQVLEHIEFIRDFISSCIGCLKPGGKLVIAVPNNEGFIKEMTNNWLNIPPHHINHWNEQSLLMLGRSFHLKTIDVFKEKVTAVHKLLYYNVRTSYRFQRTLGIKPSMVDHSLRFRILNKISYWLSKIRAPFSNQHLKKDGHTIIVVYEK